MDYIKKVKIETNMMSLRIKTRRTHSTAAVYLIHTDAAQEAHVWCKCSVCMCKGLTSVSGVSPGHQRGTLHQHARHAYWTREGVSPAIMSTYLQSVKKHSNIKFLVQTNLTLSIIRNRTRYSEQVDMIEVTKYILDLNQMKTRLLNYDG